MQKQSGISIIVCNYNADLSNILLTLTSSLKQKDCPFEVVYCDDGSKNNFEKEIVNFFKNKSFSNYQLSCLKENKGTLINLLSGLKLAKYSRSKTIGCGDLFYDEHSLKRVNDFFDKTKADVIFTKCSYFYDEDGDIKEFNVSNPHDLKCYSLNKHNNKTIQKRLLMNQDMILGAGVYADTDYLINLYEKFVGKVKYTEDALLIYGAAFNANIYYLDEYCVYYEYGTGISTSTNNAFRQIIENESNQLFDYIEQDSKDNRVLKYLKIRKKIKNSKSSLSMNLRKLFLTPSQLRIKYLDRHCKKDKAQFDFYKQCKKEAQNGI